MRFNPKKTLGYGILIALAANIGLYYAFLHAGSDGDFANEASVTLTVFKVGAIIASTLIAGYLAWSFSRWWKAPYVYSLANPDSRNQNDPSTSDVNDLRSHKRYGAPAPNIHRRRGMLKGVEQEIPPKGEARRLLEARLKGEARRRVHELQQLPKCILEARGHGYGAFKEIHAKLTILLGHYDMTQASLDFYDSVAATPTPTEFQILTFFQHQTFNNIVDPLLFFTTGYKQFQSVTAHKQYLSLVLKMFHMQIEFLKCHLSGFFTTPKNHQSCHSNDLKLCHVRNVLMHSIQHISFEEFVKKNPPVVFDLLKAIMLQLSKGRIDLILQNVIGVATNMFHHYAGMLKAIEKDLKIHASIDNTPKFLSDVFSQNFEAYTQVLPPKIIYFREMTAHKPFQTNYEKQYEILVETHALKYGDVPTSQFYNAVTTYVAICILFDQLNAWLHLLAPRNAHEKYIKYTREHMQALLELLSAIFGRDNEEVVDFLLMSYSELPIKTPSLVPSKLLQQPINKIQQRTMKQRQKTGQKGIFPSSRLQPTVMGNARRRDEAARRRDEARIGSAKETAEKGKRGEARTQTQASSGGGWANQEEQNRLGNALNENQVEENLRWINASWRKQFNTK